MSYYNFSKTDEEYFISLDRSFIENVEYFNNNHQYIFEDNQIESLKSDLQGEFSLITIIHNRECESLYYNLK